jgi:hypothetical protein
LSFFDATNFSPLTSPRRSRLADFMPGTCTTVTAHQSKAPPRDDPVNARWNRRGRFTVLG